MCNVSLLLPERTIGPISSIYSIYQTHCRDNFASVTLCRLASTKSNFRFAATTWWNSLPSHIHDCISNLENFTKAVRNFYMDHCIN